MAQEDDILMQVARKRDEIRRKKQQKSDAKKQPGGYKRYLDDLARLEQELYRLVNSDAYRRAR